MPSQIRVKATYIDTTVEEFKVLPDTTLEWIQKPGKMSLAHRIHFDELLRSIHILMTEATVNKIEVEAEAV